MKLYFYLLVFLLSLNLKSQNSDIKIYGSFIDLNKYSEEALKKLDEVKGKEDYQVYITNKCSQQDFELFCKQGWIKKLSFTGPNSQITDLTPLVYLNNLIQLEIGAKISSVEKPLDISVLTKCKNLANLKSLKILANPIKNWEKLGVFNKLTFLSLKNTSITSIDFITKLTDLTKLTFGGKNPILNLNPLTTSKNLEEISFTENESVTDQQLMAISTLTLIENVNIEGCTSVKNLDFMKLLTATVEIYATESALTTIDGIINLSKIKDLEISKTKVNNINALKGKLFLERLNIENLSISDLSPLYSCVSLEKVILNDKISKELQKALQDNLPKLNIEVNNED